MILSDAALHEMVQRVVHRYLRSYLLQCRCAFLQYHELFSDHRCQYVCTSKSQRQLGLTFTL